MKRKPATLLARKPGARAALTAERIRSEHVLSDGLFDIAVWQLVLHAVDFEDLPSLRTTCKTVLCLVDDVCPPMCSLSPPDPCFAAKGGVLDHVDAWGCTESDMLLVKQLNAQYPFGGTLSKFTIFPWKEAWLGYDKYHRRDMLAQRLLGFSLGAEVTCFSQYLSSDNAAKFWLCRRCAWQTEICATLAFCFDCQEPRHPERWPCPDCGVTLCSYGCGDVYCQVESCGYFRQEVPRALHSEKCSPCVYEERRHGRVRNETGFLEQVCNHFGMYPDAHPGCRTRLSETWKDLCARHPHFVSEPNARVLAYDYANRRTAPFAWDRNAVIVAIPPDLRKGIAVLGLFVTMD